MKFKSAFLLFTLILFSWLIDPLDAYTQEPAKPKLNSESKLAREQALLMLDEMKEILEEYYYDPKFHGIDLKKRIDAAKAQVKTLQYNWQMLRVLVQVSMELNDSHTLVSLNGRTDHFQYGFVTQMLGNECFIISIDPHSNAFKQGVRVGDQVLSLAKFRPNRNDLWKINYYIYRLDPSETIDIKVRKPDGAEKSLTVVAKTMTDKEFKAEQKAKKDKEKEKYEPFKCKEISKEVIACKLYSFSVEKNDIDKMMKQASAYPKLILDLRGNGGGYVFIEVYLLSHFFRREVKVADLVTKKKTEIRLTKPLGKEEYKGEVAVLVDSNSASAAEMTARVLQIEKRAKIYGDVSSGKVMTSISLPFRSLLDSTTYEAAIIRARMSVTIGDVIMSDGTRLENTGVIPHEAVVPTAEALVERTDPLLAYVAYKFGATLSPEDAGKFYFMVPKEDEEEEDAGESPSK